MARPAVGLDRRAGGAPHGVLHARVVTMEAHGGPERAARGAGSASSFFRWQMASALQAVFRPDAMDATVRVSLELADVEPRQWSVVAGPGGIETVQGAPAEFEVRFAGAFRAWQELVHHTTTLDALLAADAATVTGDPGALARLVAATGCP